MQQRWIFTVFLGAIGIAACAQPGPGTGEDGEGDEGHLYDGIDGLEDNNNNQTTTETTGATSGAGGTTTSGPTTSSGDASTSTTSTTTSSTATTGPTSGTTTSTGPTSTGPTGGGSACDNTGTCETCATCAQNGPCAIEYFDCLLDFACTDFAVCVDPCMDQNCVNACAAQYPTGEPLFMAYASCVVCNACYVDCDGATACGP